MCSKIFGYLGQKYWYPEYPYLNKDCCFDTLVYSSLCWHIDFIDYNGSDTHKAQILTYPNTNHSMAEIGTKISFNKSAICKFLSFNSGGMSVYGDFAISMSFPRERDPGTGTKNKIVTDWQLSVMRIQITRILQWQLNNPTTNVLAYRTYQ